MSTEQTSIILNKHKIRSTEIRRQILQIFMNAPDTALSNQDIEEHFTKIDRVTLYRVLKTFEESGVIHQAIDGSNKTKYAYCTDGCTTHHHHDEHAHFFCTNCEITSCLEMVNVPVVKIPKEYKLTDAQLVLSGICKNCQ